MHLYGRKKDLTLHGPPGLMEIITLQLKYSETCLNYKIIFKEWTPGVSEMIMENDNLTVHTIPLDHRVNCSGFLFQEKPKKRRINKNKIPDNLSPLDIIKLKNGYDLKNSKGQVVLKNEEVTLNPHPSHSYAYCSDTRYNEAIAEQIKGVSLLYHEATFMMDMQERAANTYHSTTRQAGQLAHLAQADQLIIGHFSTRYKDLQPVIEETREVFANAQLAIEGRTFTVGEA